MQPMHQNRLSTDKFSWNSLRDSVLHLHTHIKAPAEFLQANCVRSPDKYKEVASCDELHAQVPRSNAALRAGNMLKYLMLFQDFPGHVAVNINFALSGYSLAH